MSLNLIIKSVCTFEYCLTPFQSCKIVSVHTNLMIQIMCRFVKYVTPFTPCKAVPVHTNLIIQIIFAQFFTHVVSGYTQMIIQNIIYVYLRSGCL